MGKIQLPQILIRSVQTFRAMLNWTTALMSSVELCDPLKGYLKSYNDVMMSMYNRGKK